MELYNQFGKCIVYGVCKVSTYLLSQNFTLVTYNKPLWDIFT